MKADRVYLSPFALPVALLLVLLLGLPSLTYPFGQDQGVHALLGAEMLDGKVIYRDVLNIKPPLTHLMNALSLLLFGHSMLSIRILDLLWQLTTALVILRIGQRVTERWYGGPLAAVLYALWYYGFDFWNTAQTDGWQTLPVALAVLAYLHARETKQPWAYLACGVGIGLGVLFKYPIGILAPLLMLLTLWQTQQHRWRNTLLLATGLALPVIMAVCVLWQEGALDAFLLSQTRYITSYTGGQGRSYGYLTLLSLILRRLSWPTLLLWLGAGLACACGFNGARRQRLGARMPVMLWFLAGAVSFLSQAKGFAYHALPMLAPLALLTACLAGDVAVRARLKWAQLALVGLLEVALILPAFGYGQQMVSSRAFHAMGVVLTEGLDYGTITGASQVARTGEPGFSFAAQHAAAQHIAASTRASDPLFVWGFETTIYFLAERPPASRFLYNHMLYGQWAWPELREQLMQDLAAHPPAYIVVASGDALPLVTGSTQDSATALQGFDELRTLIDTEYVYETAFENLALYRRRAGP